MFKIRSSTLLFAVAAGCVVTQLSWAKDEPKAQPQPKVQAQPRVQPQPQPRVQPQPQPRVQPQPKIQAPQPQPRIQQPQPQPKIQTPVVQPRRMETPNIQLLQNKQPEKPPRNQPPANNQPNPGRNNNPSPSPNLNNNPPQPKINLPPANNNPPPKVNLPPANNNPQPQPKVNLPPNNPPVNNNPPKVNLPPNNVNNQPQPKTNLPPNNPPPPKVNLPNSNNPPKTNLPPNTTPGVTPQPQPKVIPPNNNPPGRTNDPPKVNLPPNTVPGTGKPLPGAEPKLPNSVDPNKTTPKLPPFNPNNPGTVNPGTNPGTGRPKNIPDLDTKPQPQVGNNRPNPNPGVNPGVVNPGVKPIQPNLGNPSVDNKVGGPGRGLTKETLPTKLDQPIAGVQKQTVPLHVPKNGRPDLGPKKGDLDPKNVDPKRVDLGPNKGGVDPKAPLATPEQLKNQERFRTLLQAKDHQDLKKNIDVLKQSPDLAKNPHLAHVNLDKISGLHQDRLQQQDAFQNWRQAKVGRQLDLDRQFQLQRRGDLTRQMNFSANVINAGGWHQRHHGVVAAGFTSSSFSVWYAGGGCYPAHCWYPRWSPWVSWCWWDTCVPFYDPRPYYCRPIIYDPCIPWVYYDYPVWQPLPIVTCGTWIDVEPIVIPVGMDLQLLAVRFVDNGHPEQNLGPRYRFWLRNNSQIQITQPFSALVLASNDLIPTADLPQAGVVIPTMDVGEIKPIDVRLPLAANRMGITPEGHHVPFNYLHVLVDSHQQIGETDETNNGQVVARTDILPVDPAAFSTDLTAAAPGTTLTLAGEGLGPEPGRVLISVNGQNLEAMIQGWYDLGIRFTVPDMVLTGAVDADILVVRGDGAVSNPLDLQLSPSSMLGQALEIPPAPYPEAPQ